MKKSSVEEYQIFYLFGQTLEKLRELMLANQAQALCKPGGGSSIAELLSVVSDKVRFKVALIQHVLGTLRDYELLKKVNRYFETPSFKWFLGEVHPDFEKGFLLWTAGYKLEDQIPTIELRLAPVNELLDEIFSAVAAEVRSKRSALYSEYLKPVPYSNQRYDDMLLVYAFALTEIYPIASTPGLSDAGSEEQSTCGNSGADTKELYSDIQNECDPVALEMLMDRLDSALMSSIPVSSFYDRSATPAFAPMT